jgi:glycopeptide antibiotics resistance protein
MLEIEYSNVFLFAAGVISFILLLLTKKYPKIKKPVIALLSAGYLLVLLSLSLLPIYISSYKISFEEIKGNLKPFSLIVPQWRNMLAGQPGAIRQFFGNILIFVPAGLLMPFIFKKTQRFFGALLGGFIFTLTIETLQLILVLASMSYRKFDVDDLILNTLGAIIGYIIYRIIFHRKNAGSINSSK